MYTWIVIISETVSVDLLVLACVDVCSILLVVKYQQYLAIDNSNQTLNYSNTKHV
jgi:hypothetical protein